MKIPHLKLNNGRRIPCIGFGTYELRGDECVNTILKAIKSGYRLFDTAMNYDNEGAVGKAIKHCGIPREEFFITSKLPGRYHEYELALAAVEESLYRCGLSYLDAYLIHWPNPRENKYLEAYQALIESKKKGDIRSVGVCNFLPEYIDHLINETGFIPAINQIELHPYFSQKKQLEYNRSKGIVTQSWSPLGRANELLSDSTLKEIAEANHKTIAQIILRWHLQCGALPIPKSANEQRQIENISLFDFALTEEEMKRIDGLNRANGRTFNQDPATYEEF